jgi:hypothetical protein
VKIALVGDIHNSSAPLTVAAERADVIVQLGDFALENEAAGFSPIPIYWIDGNHERFHLFAPYQDAEAPVGWARNCWYVPRGAVLELGGLRFLCIGGADSVDKVRQGARWSPHEQITGPQICRALNAEGPIDAILSHTPPQSSINKHFDPAVRERAFKLPRWWTSPAACAIEVIWQHYGRPPLFCGHMHRSVTDERGIRMLKSGEIVVLESDVPVRESLGVPSPI